MKRHIIKEYDSTNDCWYIKYIKEYENALYVQTFQTPIFTSLLNRNRNRSKTCLTGIKRKLFELWLGKGFVDQLWAIFN